MENERYPFTNTPLPYAYDALEPYIDEKTMHLHHDKHLQAYVNNLNAALESCLHLQGYSLTRLVQTACRLPLPQQTAVRNNAGGVYNHRFFFAGLCSPAQKGPSGSLAQAMDRCFGGYEKWQAQFQKAAMSVFGSGYAWLVREGCGLRIMTTANQRSPVERGFAPVLCIDVWEHAYYLKHYNDRARYVANWLNVVNWERAEQNFLVNWERAEQNFLQGRCAKG